jgi:hypothetical protein
MEVSECFLHNIRVWVANFWGFGRFPKHLTASRLAASGEADWVALLLIEPLEVDSKT